MSNISDLFMTFAQKYPEARCVSVPDEMFPLNDTDGEAKKHCLGCVHKHQCLLEAIETDSFGIWGETTRAERVQLITTINKLNDSGESK